MEKIIVGIITSDRAWFDRVNGYILKHHNSELELEIISTFMSGEENTLNELIRMNKLDMVIVDEGCIERKLSLNTCLHITMTDKIGLDVSGQKNDEPVIFKYMTANQFAEKLIRFSKGNIRKLASNESGHVKHIIVAGSYESQMSEILTGALASSEEIKNLRPLLISLSGLDQKQSWNSENMKDPFGSFIYYASSSSDKLSKHLETLVFRCSNGIVRIPKPYPFDVSQWTKNIESNVLEALNNQTEFGVVIWNLGSCFSLNFGSLLNRCDSLLWSSVSCKIEGDLSFKVFSDMSGCRLDLKTKLFSQSANNIQLNLDGNSQREVDKIINQLNVQ